MTMAESRVNRNNYISVQGFMVRDLQLKGNELLVYALIYGFSQAENQVFSGSLQYIADWTNSTKRSVMTCLKSLVDKGLVGKNEKIINGVKFCEYYATDFSGVVKNFPYPIEESSIPPIEKSSPNNIGFNNLKDNIVKDIEEKRKRFVPPTLEEVQAYCAERKNNVDAKKFYDYFTASNWHDSKGNKVKSWKQKVITWEGFSNGKIGANGIQINKISSELDDVF